MSLPITAVGPLKVLMKPILTGLPWPAAGPGGKRRERRHGNQLSPHIQPFQHVMERSPGDVTGLPKAPKDRC